MRQILVSLALLVCAPSSLGQSIQTAQPRPLADVVEATLSPVATNGKLRVPLITWGGDVATILADMEGLFEEEGFRSVELFCENNLQKQVQGALDGETWLVRGTHGMGNLAADAFERAGGGLVPIYNHTRSTGGDALVVRSNVEQPEDLRGKTIALQLWGPHMDYVAKILRDAGVGLDEVTFKYFEELTLPTFDTGGRIIDPVSAFAADASIDAVMCIIPDGLLLTSDGTVGTGAEGSVKGARVLLSTKTAGGIIFDQYFARKDYLDANREEVERFVRVMLRAEERLRDWRDNPDSQAGKYRQLLSLSGDLLLGAPQATADVEGLLGDCTYVGYAGQVAFYTGLGTTRNLTVLTDEVQSAFVDMGVMRKRVPLLGPDWDYSVLAKGLENADQSAQAPAFDPNRAQAAVESSINVEPTTWETEGTLFVIEINFDPNQSNFSESQYAADYQAALEIAQTYGGALIVIEGHSDPLGILKARQRGENSVVVGEMEQSAKNLSLRRSQMVRDSYLKYCRDRNMMVDESQFVSVGLGIQTPKFNPPRTEAEWAANRRVVFRIKQVEAELTKFVPLDLDK